LHDELKNETYYPEPLKTFILRDPKTRKISKSAFKDRIVHHAICNIIEPIFEKMFIYDSCANRIRKGNLFGLKRFDLFKRKVSENGGIIKNNFHDSNIKNITISENILQIRIDIDTHWSPGKKHGLLRLTNPQYDERFIEYWENDTDGWVESIKWIPTARDICARRTIADSSSLG